MIVGNIIFMNFIIAVVNESYENCMSKMVAQQVKVKINMIIERESVMSQSELDNEDWFPNYIVVRRKAYGSQESGQWQGFVKEIKTNFDKAFTTLQSTVATQGRT